MITTKHKRAWIPWPGRLRGYRFLGVYGYFEEIWDDDAVITYVWPWRLGWQPTSQMYETFFIGPIYLIWTWC